MIELAVFDIAGTTVSEGGTVYRVLADTVRARGVQPSADQIQRWMGASKREAIDALLDEGGAPGSPAEVDEAFADFRQRLVAAYEAEPPTPFAGVPELFASLQAGGVKVALSTGFDREVTDLLLGTLGWSVGDQLDAVVCIDDVPAGRPAPYLVFAAMQATGVTDVRRVLVAGDTVRDVESGHNAGAAVVVAVTSGEVDGPTLDAAGPTAVLPDVTGIPALLAGVEARADSGAEPVRA